jgi:hypothetical protein
MSGIIKQSTPGECGWRLPDYEIELRAIGQHNQERSSTLSRPFRAHDRQVLVFRVSSQPSDQ